MTIHKKNVLIVHNYYQIPGGEDRVVENEKNMLEKHGWQVELYTKNNSEMKNMSVLQKMLLPVFTIFNYSTYKEIKKIIQTKGIQVVHVHNTLNLISPSVYYAARSCKVPVIQTIHNFRLLCPAATLYREGKICEDCIKNGLLCSVKHACYRKSRLQTLACALSLSFHRMTGIYKKISYICLTDFNKEKMLEQGQISESQIFVKPNFVENYETVCLNKRKNQFVFAGRLDKLKGLDILLKAWKLLGDSAPELYVYGTGPMENWCRKYIEKNHLKQVFLMGYQDNKVVRKTIEESKALILPTQWYEGFPMSIVEAFSVGTPVITSDLGNCGSIVMEGVTGAKFRYDSPDELVKAIRRLNDYQTIHESTYQMFLNNYSESQNYTELSKIYHSLSI